MGEGVLRACAFVSLCQCWKHLTNSVFIITTGNRKKSVGE